MKKLFMLAVTGVTMMFVGQAARADTTICQATASGYGSYCSDQTPGAASGGYNSLPSWVSLGKTLSSITVADNQVWGLDSNGILWNLPNFKASTLTWIKVASGVSYISAGHNLLCQIATNTHLYCSVSPNPQASTPDANGFQAVTWLDEGATTYTRIALSAGNQIWALDSSNNLFQIKDYTQATASAIPVAAGVREMAVDGKGSICVTDSYTDLYCSNWAAPPTYPDATGYYHSLNSWVSTGTQLQNISLADGKVYGTDSSGSVWLLPDFTNSNTWMKIAYGGAGDKTASSTAPSSWTPASFASDEVAVLLFMGQSNSTGINTLPQRFIAQASPNVWAVANGGWTYMAGNANGTTPYAGTVASINSVSFTNWNIQSAGPDMNLGFNTAASGSAANFAAFQWQQLVNAGMKLPDLYVIHIGWASQGVDPADVYYGSAPWTVNGVNLWQPLLTTTSNPAFALAPFSRRIVYLAFQKLLASGKKPRVIGLQWNQWEAEAGNPNPVSLTDAPTNYANLFNNLYSAEGNHFPVQFIKPLSTAYGATALSTMQSVFANMASSAPADYSVLDVSTVTSNPFTGGVLGGGDGSVHYNLDTHQWFAQQAIGLCLTQAKCGTRITSVPTTATN